MRSRDLFLLVYLLGSCFGALSAQRNATCSSGETCGQVPDSTSHFLQCVGLSSTDTGRDHMRRLKGMLEAAMDVYTFMRSSMTGVPLLSLQGELELHSRADPLQNEALVQMWMEVKIKPLLTSISKHFLSCLSTKNFSCSTYQTMVRELSHHYSEMNPVRQKWIYTFFMYPFLSGDRVAGCVNKDESSEEWLMKNFGAFRAMARMKDFSSLNMVFNGLEVLHLLSPAQKAELLLRPEVAGLDNGTLSLVFHNLLTGGSGPLPTAMPGWDHNWTTPGYPPLPPQNSFRELVNGVIMAFKPVGSFVHEFVSFTRERDVSQLRSATLTQFLLNWTLAELADSYRPKNTSVVPEVPMFDVTNVEDWYQQVVMPVLRRFLPNDEALMHDNVRLAFHRLFYLDQNMDNETSEILDVCSITLDKSSCGMTDAVQNVASVLHCAARTNLTMSEATIMRLIVELTGHLNSLIKELSTANFSEVASDFQQIFGEGEPPSLTQEHLNDPNFIQLWFQIKLMPLLPSVSPGLLSCLSTKNFSCPVYHSIVAALSKHMSFLDADPIYSHNIYERFIYPFLLHHNTSNLQCLFSANHSAEWLKNNFGFFSRFAPITDFYKLNPNFSGLDVLPILSPKQMAEMLLLPLPTPPEKDVVINRVFDFLLESPGDMKLSETVHYVVLLAKEVDPPCGVYRHIFDRLYRALPSLPPDVEATIWTGIDELMNMAPEGCIIFSGECTVTMTNETDICVGVNSTMLQLHLDSGRLKGRFCDFSVEEFACASLSALKAEDLAAMLVCNRSSISGSSRSAWKLLLSKASRVLDEALDLLTNTTLDPRNPAVTVVLDSIREIRLDTFSVASFNDPALIQLWFNHRLRPFLTAVSPDFLSCLTTKRLNCSTYQHIVQILSRLQPHMTVSRQMFVYTHFIKVFLSRNSTTDPSCSLHINNSGEWLQKNLGGFSVLVSFRDLLMLYSNFSAMEALPQLTVRQLAEMAGTPGQLTSSAQVIMVMNRIPNHLLTAFFDDFSPAVMAHQSMFPPAVRSAMLQVVFDRANLSDHSVGDSVVLTWLHNRLRPLLVDLSPLHVAPFFSILAGRNCSIQQQGVQDLNSTIISLSEVTQKEIHNHIIESLKGAVPLRCYGDNYNHSFYAFLEQSFLGFQFPNLTTFLSLMPPDRMHQLVNSMPPSDLGDFLRRPDVVDNNAELCGIYNNYIQTPMFLETESLPAVVQRPTLPCVWPMALRSSKRSEVNAWFDLRLRNYLVFLTKSLISPSSTHNASCLAFQKLVSVLGEYNYSTADFTRKDVFSTIRAYLTSATVPRCYNSADPELNSTAWFAEYIGPFMPFLTLEALQAFGSAQVIQVFTVNPLNIALLNHSALPLNLTNYYTQLIYQQDSNFNPLLLPLLCRCVAPGPAFTQLTAEESMIILYNLTTLCTDLDPQISAALAGNFGDNIGAIAISLLGNESTGLSTGQIMKIKPQDLLAALSTLSSVMGWNEGQAKAIIMILMSSGMMQINSASSLFSLGSLVVGVPATTFSSISGSQLLIASRNPSFLVHLLTAPQIVQKTFVTQIVSVNSNSEMIIQNIPDDFATEIPRAMLLGFSSTTSVITTLNQKKWKRQQVELFFDVVAVETATTALGSPNNLSSSVLQGFTCTGVRTIEKVQINKLIKACRRRGKNKVILVETQLTCMYNYIKGQSDVTSFDLYPHDVLLYYDYSLVPQASCRSYFQQLADADFSVFSSVLSYKLTALFANARSCLGITSTSLTEDNISVLGNMCCTLDASYIDNSDPSILEKLKNCPDLTDAQAAAVEALLQSGKTQYGAPSTWNEQTLEDLGMLPLYLTSTFYDNFDKKTKRQYLRYFLKVLKNNRVSRQKRRRLKREIRKSIRNKTKRAVVNECTVGTITQVTISDETFPFDYDDVNQFNSCLSATTVKDNLDAITGKVDEEEYLAIVLSKLREAYAADSAIPESQVQLLGPASRQATMEDINMWTITEIDTLSALMASSNGEWDPSLAKAIVSKYLRKEGNKLGSAELSAIGGVNLCSLDVSVLMNISQQSLREAEALTVSSCTTEKKKALFTIARQAYATTTRAETISANSYQLTQSYVGGADLAYARSLSASNINMDLATFISLDENVVLSLTVDEVKGLLGTNLADLKSYENQTLVQSWIRAQPQSQLDTLGLGITGGRADATTSSPTSSPTTATSKPTSSSGSTSSTAATTGNDGARIRADAGLSFLVLLALLITSEHFLV